jgi:hypothetical protein
MCWNSCLKHWFLVSFRFYLYNVWLSFEVYNSFSSSNRLLFCITENWKFGFCVQLFVGRNITMNAVRLLPRGYQLQDVMLILGGCRRGKDQGVRGNHQKGRRGASEGTERAGRERRTPSRLHGGAHWSVSVGAWWFRFVQLRPPVLAPIPFS